MLHPSVHAIFSYHLRTGNSPLLSRVNTDTVLEVAKEANALELIEMLERDFPALAEQFGPTEAQVINHFKQKVG